MFRSVVARAVALVLVAVLALTPIPTDAAKPLASVQPIQYQGRTFCTVFSINQELGYFGSAGHCAFAVLAKNLDGKVTILGKDATIEMVGLTYDTAVFKADIHNVPALKLAEKSVEPCDVKNVEDCEFISVQGFPYGVTRLVTTTGHMAAREVPIEHPSYDLYMPSDILDLTTARGNSGSPVLNEDGEVIGILWGGFIESPHSLSVPLSGLEGMVGYFPGGLMQFVEVVWDDAWFDDDNFTTAHGLALTHKPMEVKTRGWLIRDDELGVSVANEESTTADGDKVFRGRTFIPRAMVKGVTPYRLAEIKPRKKKAKPELETKEATN